ncbi:MAG TPA: hypothetical protein VGG16_10180 [Streptosporangiaceae bacterium]|jgi:hypothetical protein
MRAVAGAGRWVWGVSGLVTVALLAFPAARIITTAGPAGHGQPSGSVTRTVTVPQRVTSLTVQSYGAPVQVTGAPVSHVKVSETFAPDGSVAPPVAASVRNGQLSVGSSACMTWENCANFVVIVPSDMVVSVDSQGGPVTVSGVGAVNLNTGGGFLSASRIAGPVDVSTDGGPAQLAHVTGPVQVDTGGGSLSASAVTAASAIISTEGGPAQLTGSIGRLYVQTGGGSADVTLATAPETVTIGSDGGPAALVVPGGPYAISTQTDGGPQSVSIASSTSATRSITVTTGGGSLQIGH